jgi:threonyl-tRNA synthetase
VVLGSLERFIGILIEHYGGRFPLWLSPVQVAVLSITQDHEQAAADLTRKLSEAGIRAVSDLRSEKLGYKMREAETGKTPYIAVIGDREIEENTISVRKGRGKNLGAMKYEALLDMLQREIGQKS